MYKADSPLQPAADENAKAVVALDGDVSDMIPGLQSYNKAGECPAVSRIVERLRLRARS